MNTDTEADCAARIFNWSLTVIIVVMKQRSGEPGVSIFDLSMYKFEARIDIYWRTESAIVQTSSGTCENCDLPGQNIRYEPMDHDAHTSSRWTNVGPRVRCPKRALNVLATNVG